MIITPILAQQIVDIIIPVVQHNVNIMNNSGIIIGSGQKHRINTFHQGAHEVITSGVPKEIYPADVERFPGALPGLNWPIILGNQIVGVVGVSGNPDEVRNTAKLVKMVTELILERENLVEEFQANMQLREQFGHLLLSDKCSQNHSQITKLASLLRFDLNRPRLAAVIDISGLITSTLKQYGSLDLVTARARENLEQIIRASNLLTSWDLFFFSENEMIILKHFGITAKAEAIYQWGTAFVEMIQTAYTAERLLMGIGSLVRSSLELQHSFTEAMYAKTIRSEISGLASIDDLDILVSYLISHPGSIDTCYTYKKLKDTIGSGLERKYDMRNTVNALLSSNLNISTAAKSLYIHRNTLIFRLEKLKELTGLCPSQFLNHAMLCKLLFS